MIELQRIVIVGSGLGGATAAATLRENGFGGQVLLIGQEKHQPYELPALSKGVLLGSAERPDLVRTPDFYRDKHVDLLPSTEVSQIRPRERVVVAGGVPHRYDRLLLATGSRPRTPPVPVHGVSGVHVLRTVEDALAIRDGLVAGARVVIVGAGWIGCEVAAAARAHDAEVIVVDSQPLPLLRALGPTVAAVFRDLHAAHGVNWRLGAEVAGLVGDRDGVRAVRLADGTELAADLVVLGVGAAPRVELARAAGLELAAGGVAVDAMLRTSAPDVFAVGDIAAHQHPRYGQWVRVEHWANAKDQGALVAANLVGGCATYASSPYFFSDQYDLGLEYRGLADLERDQLVVRGDLAAREFIAFWLRGGRVRAAMNVNMWDDGDALSALVDRQAVVDLGQLVSAELNALD
ncbi:FAD-dependent oxidoreductase [Kutzneria viridogrisea]|uniref:Ferredoxin reductase n=2 Tax=Kutzneria TaxID=43356 RepID=W5W2Q0_9PSEU|nr:FAD-dependent oxidoreductase [Kutzneria albida]AHH94771.1 ferredoxin reductase [Kutzneria albida DSM 43870]MBA8930439.1 NADPH-dependent 2,4-dienoyl-CoA reductase/sulfur reductase-like enzyme [Kutzneria viridogrisea]